MYISTYNREMDKFIRKIMANESTIKMVHPSNDDRSKSVEKDPNLSNMNSAYSYRPIYYFSRIFGLMPFSIIYSSDGRAQKPRVSVFDGLWFVISICIYILMAVISYKNIILPTNSNSSYLMILGDYVLLILGLFIGALTIGMDMCNRFKIVDILKMFDTFDNKVKQDVIPKYYSY